MRFTLGALAIAGFSVVLVHAQDEAKTFSFSHPVSPEYLTAVITTLRTVVDLRDVSFNQDRTAIQARGSAEKMLAIDWLVRQLDAPPDSPAERPLLGETVAVMPLSASATLSDVTALTTAIRTTIDLQRMIPLESRKVIVARGPADKVAAAQWLIQQVLPRDGRAPDGDSPVHSAPIFIPKGEKAEPVLRVFRMASSTTNRQLTNVVTAIRTVADLQRVFPFDSQKAIITSGASDKVALAGWLVHELVRPGEESVVYETTLPDGSGDVVRLFLLPDGTDVATLANEVRDSLQLRHVYSFGQPPGLLIRAQPKDVSIAAIMVASFLEHAH